MLSLIDQQIVIVTEQTETALFRDILRATAVNVNRLEEERERNTLPTAITGV